MMKDDEETISEEQILELINIRAKLIQERDELLESIKEYEKKRETSNKNNIFNLMIRTPSEEMCHHFSLKNLSKVCNLLAETYIGDDMNDEDYAIEDFRKIKKMIEDNSFRYVCM